MSSVKVLYYFLRENEKSHEG